MGYAGTHWGTSLVHKINNTQRAPGGRVTAKKLLRVGVTFY